MAPEIFVYILHKEGAADDSVLELVNAARKIDSDATVNAVVFGNAANVEKAAAAAAKTYNTVWTVADDALAYPNAEVIRGMLARIIPAGSLFLMPHDHFGMDLSAGLAVKLGGGYLADVTDIEGLEGDLLKATREEFSGMVSTHVTCDVSAGAVVSLRPGAFAPDESQSQSGEVVDKTAAALEGGLPAVARQFLEVVEAEKGDVDITKADVLVSVGRGIEDEDNIEIIFDLAEATGGEVSCSRPIVDAKWLEKSRQVGTSGQTVKPKVYMALGISGSFQHLGGIKGAPYMVAVNKNTKAPIFQVADVGIEADILDFVPELTDKINEIKG
jgi:electron transfer flavoprotein alpha subunit